MFLDVLAQAILYLFELAQVMTKQDFKMANVCAKKQVQKGGHVKGLQFAAGAKFCSAASSWQEILFAVNIWENASAFGF